jgi:delta 1-pyrroline-5-carboxylate dehydrogenase
VDREEAVLNLRKNKLDMEHEELLQDRNVIVITEVGIPITLINAIIATSVYTPDLVASLTLATVVFMGITEVFRRRNKRKILSKRNEIDAFIREIQTHSP